MRARLCLHSLLGRVGELVLPLPSVAFLDPRVAPQALDGVGIRARQCLHFLHFDLADHGGVCLRDGARHSNYKKGSKRPKARQPTTERELKSFSVLFRAANVI